VLAGPMMHPGSVRSWVCVPIRFLPVAMPLENRLDGDDRNQSSEVVSVPGPPFGTLIDKTILG